MVRYKRYNRRRSSSTRTIKMKFQSFMDINTSKTSMQILTVSAGGKNVLRRLAPQFGAYKYYKLGGVSVKLVPASTLPVDPTGLSYSEGEQFVDPRDQLTPGMMRITNGEDIFEDITGLTDEEQHAIYNNMLLDPRWFKWMLQSGVRRFASPRYWQIGQLHQDKYPGQFLNVPKINSTGTAIGGTSKIEMHVDSEDNIVSSAYPGSSELGFFQTGHTGKLGWMPTDELAQVRGTDGFALLASPPEVEVMKIILPKAYKTEYYYRMFVTETVYFKEPIVNFGIPVGPNDVGTYRPLDVFHYPPMPVPKKPYELINMDVPDYHTGGNYGDN